MSRVVRSFARVAGLLLFLPLLGVVATATVQSGAAAPTFQKVQIAPRLPAGTTDLGAVAATSQVSGDVVLQPRDPGALQKFIARVTDKSSPDYHDYLSRGAFGSAFGPSTSTISAVEEQLTGGGLRVTSVASDGLVIRFQGAATKVETAFQTTLDRYKLADGSTGIATTRAVLLPSSIAPSVVAVVGLDNLVHAQPAGVIRAPKSKIGTYPAAVSQSFTHPAGSPSACTTAAKNGKTYGGLTDDQIANAYGAFGLYKTGDFGATQTIAVYELGAFTRTQIHAFDSCYFGATKATAMSSRLATEGTTSALYGIDGGQPHGATIESSLDVEDVSALAPTSNIDVYQAPNTTAGGLDEYSAIVNQDTAQVVTTSWGLCEQAVQTGEPGLQQAENVLFEQAAAQGQSVFAAAGDEGSDDCNSYETATPVAPVLSVDDPGSQPYVVSVGGTTISDATQPPTEHVWNDGALWGAGGGGISQSWPITAWQLDSGVPGVDNAAVVTKAETFMTTGFCRTTTNAGTAVPACREVPDVSAQADEFTGAITMYTTTATPKTGWFTIGGTSSATPIWAGLLALVNDSHDSSVCRPSVHGGVGFVSPLLYGLASSPSTYAQSFSDIKTGNNDPYGDSHLFPATTGYDMASGLGSPKLTNTTGASVGLAYDLCSLATPTATHAPTPDVTAVTPPYGPTSDGGVTATIFGKHFCTATASKIDSVAIGNFVLPAADVHSVTCATTPEQVTVTLPASTTLVPPGDTTDGAGAYQVMVSLADGISSHTGSTSSFTYVDENATTPPGAVPEVTSVRAPAGSDTGGNTVDIFGTGFSTATAVNFGGVAATFTLKSPYELVATAPPLATATTCANTTPRGVLCQVTVVVTGPGGISSTGSHDKCRGSGAGGLDSILPPIHGHLTLTPLGVATTPSGEEAAPQPCEYDYIPQPEIHTVSTSAGPASYASEGGGTVITIRGQGFNLFGLDWVSIGFGTGDLAATQDFTLLSVTNTKIELVAPPITNTGTTGTLTVPIRVRTLSGTSHAYSADFVQYAGVPSVSSVHSSLVSAAVQGASTAPATTPTSVTITGARFGDVYAVEFVDVFHTFGAPFSFGKQYTFTTRSTTAIDTATVPQNPGVVFVTACTVTGCYTPFARTATTPTKITITTSNLTSLLYLFPPGPPVVDSISPTSGYAAGGTTVKLTGENLGCTYAVTIAGVLTKTVSNTFSLLDCGTTTSVTAVTAPAPGSGPLPAGPVKAETIESTVTGTLPISHATFTYIATPPHTTGAPPPAAPTPPAPPVGSHTSKSGAWSTSGTHTVADTPIGVTVTAQGPGAFTIAGYTGHPQTTTTAEGATGTYVDVAVSTDSGFTALTIKVCPTSASTGLVWWNGAAWLPFSDATVQSTGCITASVTSTSTPSLKQLTGTPIAAVKSTASRVAGQTADATAAAELEKAYSAATASTHPSNCVGGTAGTTPTATRTVVVTTDQHFQDALSSQYLASSLRTGTLLTPTNKLSTATIAALKLEGITNVDVVGGPLAVSTAVVSQLENTPAYSCGGAVELQTRGRVRTIKATRIYGSSAYDTAQKVAETPPPGDVGKAAFPEAYGGYNDTTGISSAAPSGTTLLSTAILADGQEFQDAEAASVMSYEDHFPILLTAPATLSPQAAAALKALTVHQVIVMGGPAAVSNAVVTSLKLLGMSVLRIAGTDAADTASKLATFEVTGSNAGLGWTPAGGVLVASGTGYTDGLAGAVLQVHYGAYPEPLLLTEGASAAGTALTAFLTAAGKSTGINATDRSIFKLHVLGGSLAITTALVTQMVSDLTH